MIYNWTNTQRVLERSAPVLADKYQELGNLSKPITYVVGDLEITLNLPEYAYYVEHGRGPGKYPPLQAIENWVEVKHIVPRQDYTVKQVSYLIARKIAREGTQGKHAAQGTIDYFKNVFLQELYLAIVEDVKSNIIKSK